MKKSELKDRVRLINKALNNSDFEPFINHIRFPYFKNIEENARIDFTFPITALVGQNGTNKSSVIKALFGCPYGRSITRYWFTTDTDEFPDLKLIDGTSLKPRYIYGYKNQHGQVVEILQSRINATKQSIDYWETSRPLKADGMESVSSVKEKNNATRWGKIKKGLVFIDFRSEISAFDRCMYHSDFKLRKDQGGKSITKQEHIREKSKYIKRSFDEELLSFTLWGKEKIVKNISLDKNMVEVVSFILGRKYHSIKYLEHRFWGTVGGTAQLSTDKLNYTEAYAGSGEFAVVSLVLNIFNAKEKSLILLDEPEVSLHPGAQKRMLETIYDVVQKNKHQVVISTHSPTIVNMLPNEAIKLFSFDVQTETSKITQNISADEAFVEIGQDVNSRTVISEDRLAMEIICRAIKSDEYLVKSFAVKFIPGGSETILSKHLPSYALVHRNDIIIMLDGDKNKMKKPPKIDSIADSALISNMVEHFGCELIVNASGNKLGVNKAELIKLQRQTLEYAFEKVQYLPFYTPEEFLITEALTVEEKALIDQQVWDANNKDVYKEKIRFITKIMFSKEEVSGDEIFAIQKILTARISSEHNVFKAIRNSLTLAFKRGIIE